MPDQDGVMYQQKLLAMYRALLKEFLYQREQWDKMDVPAYLSTGIEVIRTHILDAKSRLRVWNIEVADHPDDEGSRDDLAENVQFHRRLLDIHRANLKIYLGQVKQIGIDQVAPIVLHSIQLNRSEIQRIKAILRGYGVAVDDLPEEEEA